MAKPKPPLDERRCGYIGTVCGQDIVKTTRTEERIMRRIMISMPECHIIAILSSIKCHIVVLFQLIAQRADIFYLFTTIAEN